MEESYNWPFGLNPNPAPEDGRNSFASWLIKGFDLGEVSFLEERIAEAKASNS